MTFEFADAVEYQWGDTWRPGKCCGPAGDGWYVLDDQHQRVVLAGQVRAVGKKRVVRQMMQKYYNPWTGEFIVKQVNFSCSFDWMKMGAPFEMECEVPE